jgi:hypothetical protein
MLDEVLLDHLVEQTRARLGKHSSFSKDLSQRNRLAEQPDIHRFEELLPRDEVHLQGEQPEDQIAIGRRGH